MRCSLGARMVIIAIGVGVGIALTANVCLAVTCTLDFGTRPCGGLTDTCAVSGEFMCTSHKDVDYSYTEKACVCGHVMDTCEEHSDPTKVCQKYYGCEWNENDGKCVSDGIYHISFGPVTGLAGTNNCTP